jgi:signal transduction histidine kinase
MADRLSRLAWWMTGLAVVLVGASLLRQLAFPQGAPVGADRRDWLVAVVFTAIGARLLMAKPQNAVAWLLLTVGVCGAGTVFAASFADTTIVLAWTRQWIWWPTYGLLPVALLLFPDGMVPSRRWRWALRVAWLGAVVPTLFLALAAFGRPTDLVSYRPPVSEGTRLLILGAATGMLSALFGMLAAAVALLWRWRRSRGDERQQCEWLLSAGVLVVVSAALEFFLGVPGAWLVGAAALPVAMGVAIMKYRLYEIDPIINRSLVYAALTASVVTLYVATVGLLGTVFARSGLPVSLAAAGVVAVVFQPLRDRLQRAVDRLMYGRRDDPYAVLSELGLRLEATMAPDAVLPSVVETVANTLKLPYVGIELHRGEEFQPAAHVGRLVDEPLHLPLVYQQETVGRLIVSPRAPGEAFSPADLRLLADVARQAGIATHAVRLTVELLQSRQRLVTAREEERRRLRRDLHDGLGPILAGVVLQLSAAKGLLADRDTVARLLDKLRGEMQGAIAEIRQVVYELRPPALDELGLAGALREQTAMFNQRSSGPGRSGTEGLTVMVEAPPDLGPLPAAVEVAAYRIAAEATANVVRHAQARNCQIRLTLKDLLDLEVCDDGRGLPPRPRPGAGLSTMRERAAELGGTCTIAPRPGGGTRVHAQLPLRQDVGA